MNEYMAEMAGRQIEAGLHTQEQYLKRIEELEAIVRIQAYALDNSKRHIDNCNERIVEFNDLKKAHIKVRDNLMEEIKALKIKYGEA